MLLNVYDVWSTQVETRDLICHLREVILQKLEVAGSFEKGSIRALGLR